MFRIAQINIAVSAQQPLRVETKWQRFAADPSQIHLHYEVCYEPSLPAPNGETLYRDRHIRILQTEQGRLRIYSNFCTGTDTASVLEQPPENGHLQQQITIVKDRFPWGTAVGHLLELYDLPHYMLLFGKMLLHCAYVLYEGKAILFTAPSGTGKSTQAELWRQHFGAQIVNGDRAAVGVSDEVAMAYGLPFSGSSDDCENVDASIAAIVVLSQAKENRLQRLSGKNALKQLMRGAYLLPEHQDDLLEQMEIAAALLRHAPIYHLACLPDVSAAQLLQTQLWNDRRLAVMV